MRKIIINLIVLSVLGSSAFAMDYNTDNLGVLKKWVLKKVAEASEYCGVEGDVGKAAVTYTVGALTGKGDNYSHLKNIKVARTFGTISEVTVKKLKLKCLDSLSDEAISRIEDEWLKIASSDEPCDFDTYINGYIRAARAKKMSAKRYLIKLYGTKSEKFWHGVW